MCETCSKLRIKPPNNINNVILVLLFLTLNRPYTLFWNLHCWLWTCKYHLGSLAASSWHICKTVHTKSLEFELLFDNIVKKFDRTYCSAVLPKIVVFRNLQVPADSPYQYYKRSRNIWLADDSSDRSNIFIRIYSFSNRPSIQMIQIPSILNLTMLVLMKS